ncbi:CzcE family metal-binding protein [Herbaspirillum aquaticum]|uniref:CzcE family metal-binding protein n=1 Tax=Herbaspirillum aquaticum TaxID=568783 RepID=UPI0024DE11D9|nr:CzcE family metal-binding protein [Herbaspirillum aquaticum]
MKITFAAVTTFIVLLASLVGLSAPATAQVADPYGMTASNTLVDREIQIAPSTKYVNVNQGETVRFVAQGKSFVWKFDTFGQRPFELAKIAPADFAAPKAVVYLGSNPLYHSR